MEMETITAEAQKTDEGEAAAEQMVEVKTQEAEPDHYAKLQSATENVYSESFYSGLGEQTSKGKQTEGNLHLYRRMCLVLAVICLIFLLITIVLGLKLQDISTACRAEDKVTVSPPCSFQECQGYIPDIYSSSHGCQQCARGWLKHGRSCFFLSKTRLIWSESVKFCASKGGSLAVITSREVQHFLTNRGNLLYWIGLKLDSSGWSWVNHQQLSQSFWREPLSDGDCGFIDSNGPTGSNWGRASCQTSSYFICEI